MELRNYIYLDERSIEGLYNQLYDKNIIEEKVLSEKEIQHTINGSIESSGILKKAINVIGNYGLNHSKKILQENTLIRTVEQKANEIIKYVSNDEIADIKTIIEILKKDNRRKSIIFTGYSIFTLTDM